MIMGTEDRLDLRIEQFDKAVAALKLALDQPEDEFMRDSIIKRFELSFETGRKAMRQWLMDQQEISGQATKKELMESAFRTGLIGDADLWNELARYRNDSSHEYEQAKAVEAAAFIRQRAAGAFDELLGVLKSRA
jgi:nucleotidyltransferase substrate binding protein (TIGR01987 family)